jgi:hypothetical protein
MPKFKVWRVSTVKERVLVEADTVEDALENVVEDSDKFEFEFVDADSTYEAYPTEEDNE